MTCVDKAVFLYLFVFIAICEAQESSINYQVPTPIVEALYPKGFRVTLKDDGYEYFVFHGNVKKHKELRESGVTINKFIRTPKDGYWVYENRDAELAVGDTIYYYIYIYGKKSRVGYTTSNLEYTVSEFVKEDGTRVVGQTGLAPPGPPTLKETSTPDPYDQPNKKIAPLAPDCLISKTKVQYNSNICKDQLIFNEEFDETNLRELKKWDAMIQFPAEPDYPFNVYIPDSTVNFEEGSLVITPVLTESQHQDGFLHRTLDLGVRCTGRLDTPECKRVASGAQILPPVTTAKISTRRSFNFMFGRVEVRAKLPSGSWIIPEINLEPTDNTYGPNNYESGLMRIAFVRGNPSLAKKLYGGPVLTNSEPFRSLLLKEKIGIDNWHRDYHNYSMIWRPDGIDLLVDGEQYGTVNPGGGFFEVAKQNNVGHASHWQRGTVMAPLDQMFHLTLGLCVGGVSDFADDLEGKPWRNRASKAMLNFWKNKDSWYPSWYNDNLRVDYVRVYAL